MIVGIVGSRGYPNRPRVLNFVYTLGAKYPDTVVVSGRARDVDTWAEEAAIENGLGFVGYGVEKFDSIYDRPLYTIDTVTVGASAQEIVVAKHRRINPPCFRTFAKAAFYRSGLIVEDADQLVAFWDGKSRGTAYTLGLAKAVGVPTYVYRETA